MSQYADSQYEKALRKRCDCDAKGIQNPPPQLRLTSIALKYGKTTDEVIADIEAMRKPKEEP